MFEYRFIRFLFNHETQRFEPIVFNETLPFNEIHQKLSQGVSEIEEESGANYFV
jgi:hypothetical protein